ncbi:MAG TPA: hypothetical protein VHN99_11065 [Deinococcales bacterium]|nr:hypothetical protein [Deinococcales bacterium]
MSLKRRLDILRDAFKLPLRVLRPGPDGRLRDAAGRVVKPEDTGPGDVIVRRHVFERPEPKEEP